MSLYKELYDEYVKLIDVSLRALLKRPEGEGAEIYDVMAYSLFASGKRVRPVLLLEFCRASGGDMADAIPLACAIEMIHTYSLIHDDLPCMDNDDLRRGKPTSHKAFGEAMALLAGDGLLNLAYEIMLSAEYRTAGAPDVMRALYEIARAAGMHGMISGQVGDLNHVTPDTDEKTLLDMIGKKTGALIKASARAGVIIGGGSGKQLAAAGEYAAAVGLAFQIRDDLLDRIGDSASLGKNTSRDVQNGKVTTFDIYGREQAERMVTGLTEKALASLEPFEDKGPLTWLAQMLLTREN